MSLIITGSNSNESEFKLPPAGNHIARCYRIIDLGTQTSFWKGEPKSLRKIMISWELHGEDADGNPLTTEKGEPLMMSRRYTMSLSEKATLRIMLEGWRNQKFTLDELSGFDISKLLGVFCMLNISHDKSEKDGKTYANVAGVSPVPAIIKKAGLPEGVNKTVLFSLDNPDMSVFNGFSDGIKKTISESPEFKKVSGGVTLADAPAPKGLADIDDDVPF